MYLDSAYITKYYVNEPDSPAVRAVIGKATRLVSSAWAMGEVSCALHRHLREGSLSPSQARELLQTFLEHVDAGVWNLIPVTERLLRRTAALVGSAPEGAYIRAGDAIHLTTAQEVGEMEIWTSDRHVLSAAPHFGLTGRSA